MKRLGLILILIVVSGQIALAQNSATSSHPSLWTAPPTSAKSAQDDPIAKALEQAVNRLAVAEEKNRLLEDRLQAKDATILNLEGVIAVRNEQLELAKSANKDRAGANTIDQFRVEACQTQLAKADARIYALEHPGFFASLFDKRTITGMAVGFGAGRFTK